MPIKVTASTSNGAGSDKETLYLLGAAALLLAGAGLLLCNPVVRRYLSRLGVGNLAQAAIPDIARYLKLRAM